MRISVHSPPDPRAVRDLENRLAVFNRERAPDLIDVEVLVEARTRGTLRGGALGIDQGGWMFLHVLWVEPEHRGKGVATALMAKLEETAAARGCHGLHTDTFSFQALPFYLGLGFEVFGELPGYTGGHTRYYLRKPLAPA